MLKIGMVAGETSGDLLGAGLVRELVKLDGDIVLEGIGGQQLIKAGMKSLYPMDMLSVMGITEVLGRYRSLKAAQNSVRDHFLNNPPDVFIGVDAPDFNLPIELVLRQAGIPTIHYVSPSVWAWREYRIKKIKQAVDLMLTLFPFENAIYDKYQVPSKYVGHPLADRLKNETDSKAAREQLNVQTDSQVIAVLPGSRMNEINTVGPVLLAAAVSLHKSNPGLRFISGLANEKTLQRFRELQVDIDGLPEIDLHIGKTHQVMLAADYIMLASGTATLEAMLLNRPMVVAYRLSWLTYYIVKSLAKIPYASLPNILANRQLVPECLQRDCTAGNIAAAMLAIINDPERTSAMKKSFRDLSASLAVDADRHAAEAVLELLNSASNA